ncbi:MAG: hypothetical protein ACM309_00815 [Bacillota bacterium]
MRLKVNPASVTEIAILGLVLVMVLAFAGFAAIGMWAVFGR